MKIWDQYKHIKCGDFIAWWSKLSTKQKLEWKDKKEKIDQVIEDEFWDRESRRVKNNRY